MQKKLLYLSASSLCLLAAGTAQGQGPVGPGEASIGQGPLDEVVVSATRTEREAFSTPVAVSVINNSQFDLYQPQNYADVFEGIPGVSIQGGSRRIAEEPNVRGFLDEQVVIRIDGARQNFDLAHRGRFFADQDLVERIEIVRGGSSALYGSGAIGGVISVETKGARNLLRADENIGARIKLGYQTNGEEPLISGGVFGATDTFDAFANFVYRDIDEDLEDGAGNPIADSKDRVMNGLVKLGFEPADGHRLEITGDLFDSDGENPTAADSVSSPTTVVGRDTKEYGIRARYNFNPDGNPYVDLNAVAFFTDVDISEDRFFDSRLDESDFRSFGFDVYNTSRVELGDDGKGAITYGFEYFKDEQSGLRNGAARIQFPDAERTFLAGYAQFEVELFDQLTFIPGARFDSFSVEAANNTQERKESRFSPRIAVGWEPADWFYLFGSYSEAFRAPSLTQLYNDGTHFVVPGGFGPGSVVVNNFVATPLLDPEKADTYEVGFRVRGSDLLMDNDTLELSGTYFNAEVEDFVDQIVTFVDFTIPPVFTPPFGPITFFGTTQNRNIDAEIKGVEGELRYDSTYLLATLSGTLTDGDNVATGEGLGSIPQNSVSVQLVGKIPTANVQIGGRATFASAQNDVPAGTVTADRYQTVDLFGVWAPDEGPLEGAILTVGADNVFDEDYSVFPTVIKQPGRSVRASIGYRFGR